VIRTLAFAAAMTLMPQYSAAIQQGAAIRVTDAQVVDIPVAVRAQIRTLADSALREGLPADPVLNIGLKSRQFSASPALVAEAARNKLAELRSARQALGPDASHLDIEAGAHAIRAGMEPDALRRFASEKRSAALYVAIGVLSELVSLDVPVDTAVRIVTQLGAAGLRDAELTSYRQIVLQDILRGALPAASASIRAEATMLRGGPVVNGLDMAAGPTNRAAGRVRIPPEEH
jgi:hypothetical protein